ncbi:MAG: Gfo/Idh/MocA family protein [Puniceicoccales bacterium]
MAQNTDSESNRPIRFALVGCGSIAKTQIKALLELSPQAEIVYICDRIPERSAALAKEFSLKSLDFASVCADPEIDAVTFCTPSGVHAGQAMEALRAGKNVVVEKPMDVTVEACEALKAVAEASGKRFSVISQHRFDPASQTVRKAVEDKRLGELIFAEARIPWYRTQEYYDSGDWRGTWELDGGGCLMNQGIHTVDLMLWLAGPVKRVFARMKTVSHERIEVEDLITVQIEFESGMMGSLVASTSLYPGYPITLGLFGDQGSAVIEGDELQTLAIEGEETIRGKGANAHALQVATGGTRSATHEAEKTSLEEWKWGDAHREQYREFVHCIHAGTEPTVTANDGLNAVKFIQASYRSARTGDWVELG